MSGRSSSTEDSRPASRSASAVTGETDASGSSASGTGAPTSRCQRVPVLGDEPGERGHVVARRLHARARPLDVEGRGEAGLLAPPGQLEGPALCLVGVLRQPQQRLVRAHGQPGRRDFGDEADVRGALRLRRGQVFLPRALLEVAHAAEQVQLVRREADLGTVLVTRRAAPVRRERRRDPLRRLGRDGLDGRELVGALDAVQGARTLDVQGGDAQVTVVGQAQRDHAPQAIVGVELPPSDLGHRGRALARRPVRGPLRPLGRHGRLGRRYFGARFTHPASAAAARATSAARAGADAARESEGQHQSASAGVATATTGWRRRVNRP